MFGDVPDPGVYRGVGPMTFYAPAYVGLVMASVGLVTLPAHLAGYREKGVLRRFHASSFSAGAVLGAQVVVTFVVALVGGLVVVVLCVTAYGADLAEQWVGVAVAFVAGALCFAAIGVLLGAVLATARAALGAGVLLWFVMLFISGAGPPPEVLTGGLRAAGALMPLTYVITALQDPWLGLGWSWGSLAVTIAVAGTCWALAVRLLRWE